MTQQELKTMWVITRAVNDYNQYGDYFEGVFDHKPSIDEIKQFLNCDENYAEHICNGGGRRGYEPGWYFLTEIKSGERYEHS